MMNVNGAVALMGVVLVLVMACGAPSVEPKTDAAPKEPDTLASTQETVPSNPGSAESKWQADPASVVEAIFAAARTKDFSKLAGLCDPAGTGDGDTKQICSIAFAPEEGKNQFVQAFMYGQVIGKPVIVADTAMVQIMFDQQGGRDESMRMIRRNGLWYLASF
ncbi:MAG: hypothetical protein IPN62_09380 [Flavobacteriales bacterium]|nr:hypothetical protein [Flavobacteriales bacterium]